MLSFMHQLFGGSPVTVEDAKDGSPVPVSHGPLSALPPSTQDEEHKAWKGLNEEIQSARDDEPVDSLLTQFPPYGTQAQQQKPHGAVPNSGLEMAADLALFSPLAWLGFDGDDLEEGSTDSHRFNDGDEEDIEGEEEFYSCGPEYIQEKKNAVTLTLLQAKDSLNWAQDEIDLWYNAHYHMKPRDSVAVGITNMETGIDSNQRRIMQATSNTSQSNCADSKVSRSKTQLSWHDQVRSVTLQWIDGNLESAPPPPIHLTSNTFLKTNKETHSVSPAQSHPENKHYHQNSKIQNVAKVENCGTESDNEHDASIIPDKNDGIITESISSVFSFRQLPKTCNACEAPFTKFRRRHYCATCGNLFCSRCCSFFMNVPSEREPSSTGNAETVSWKSPFSTHSGVHTCCEKCHNRMSAIDTSVEVQLGNTMHEEPSSNSPLAADTSPIHIAKPPAEGRNTSRRFGKLAELGALSWQVGSVGVDNEENKLIGTGVKESDESTDDKYYIFHSDAVNSTMMVHSQGKMEGAEEVQQLRQAATDHLERLARDLLITYAPILIEQKSTVEIDLWIDKLIKLATRACSTVKPNVRGGDLLDIRPYCKVKVIPGGDINDCAYISGVMFRKQPLNKNMLTNDILNPKLLLISGGIEYNRNDSRITSFGTLLEQEERHLEVLINKITKLSPDILIVGRSVSRKAQDLFLKANILLLQSVKPALLERISRQTTATILSSAEIINHGTNVLGHCKRFRLVTFKCGQPNLDFLLEGDVQRAIQGGSVDEVISQNDEELPHRVRHKVACAKLLGDSALDCLDATKCGLAKRDITTTYALIEGCPEVLGATIVFRGASKAALKQVKAVFKQLVNYSYNLKLEISYMSDRKCRLPPGYTKDMSTMCSSSLCVDYGSPPLGRKVKPWNGCSTVDPSQRLSSRITVGDHQSILISTIWMTGKSQCCPAEVKGICYYSLQDVSLGQFLRDSCFNTSLKCQNPNCKKSLLEHSLSFVHNDGMLKIIVDEINPSIAKGFNNTISDEEKESTEQQITTWSYCNNCKTCVTPVVHISDETYAISFGKVLEIAFYNRLSTLNAPSFGCACPMQTSCSLYFGCGNLTAKFTYEPVYPYGVFVCRHLPFDSTLHVSESLRALEVVSNKSETLFQQFEELIDRVSADTRRLFGSPVNRPEHLQTVLSELNAVGLDVSRANKFFREKVSAFTEKYSSDFWQSNTKNREALLQFPWQCRKYIFIVATAWNERLSSIGQALNVMKRLAASSQSSAKGEPHSVVSNVVGEVTKEEVLDAMSKLHQVKESYASLKVTDVMALDYNTRKGRNARLPNLSSSVSSISDEGTETGQQTRKYKHKSRGSDDFEFHDMDDDNILIGGSGLENDITGEVDADVLVSRRRYALAQEENSPTRKSTSSKRRPTVSEDEQDVTVTARQDQPNPTSAVKTALNLLFYRRNKELDPYVINLGIFGQGRPKLKPCMNGWVMPVFDEQPSTIISYSLASSDYHMQFHNFDKLDGSDIRDSRRFNVEANDEGSLDEYFARSGSSPKRRRDKLTRSNSQSSNEAGDERKDLERRMLLRTKTHIKHTFRDHDEKGQPIAKFVCTTYWAVQFHALRQIFLKDPTTGNTTTQSSDQNPIVDSLNDVEKSYIFSLISSYPWQASGGKSGASFARTSDDRFILKSISRTELQMFLDCANAYFEYLSKSFFHGLPTVLCKIVGVYQIGYHNRVTGKKTMEQIAVMQNIFYGRNISKVFDLKGSIRGRQAKLTQGEKEQLDQSELRSDMKRSDSASIPTEFVRGASNESGTISQANVTLLDGDFLEYTGGAPMPLNDRANAVFHMSILNDTLFLTLINVLDYSILVGIDEERKELVVGIIDFMRQYDILKQMERVGKSIPSVVAGVEAPTIIQPPLYKDRFIRAMEKYFMTVPNKYTSL